jgi:hypothetical protein
MVPCGRFVAKKNRNILDYILVPFLPTLEQTNNQKLILH